MAKTRTTAPAPTAVADVRDLHERGVHVLNDPGVEYVGRRHPGFMRRGSYRLPRSDWANPFKVGLDGTREECIALYECWLLNERPDLVARLPELRDKVLACSCAPGPCHAHVLARLADEGGAIG